MALYKRLFVNITRAARNLYNEFIIQQASFCLEKVRYLQKSTAAVYINQYTSHDYPMKSDVPNVQYYKVADLRHVVFSLLRLKMRKLRKHVGTTKLDFVVPPCFDFFLFTREKRGKKPQKEGENTTHKICRIFTFHLSGF
jgi:hypothetical protein